MKKLMMLAASMTIVGGAYSADCGLGTSSNAPCSAALVYDVKISVKTTAGKSYSGECYDSCYRAKSSRSYKGYLYACGCTCDDLLAAEFYLVDKKNDDVFEGAIEWNILSRIGKKNLDAEGLFEADLADAFTSREFIIAAAGFGAFDKKTGQLKSMSGNVVGTLTAPECVVPCDIGEPAVAFPACDWQEDSDVETVAFGTWSIKYNKKLSQRYYANLWEPGM